MRSLKKLHLINSFLISGDGRRDCNLLRHVPAFQTESCWLWNHAVNNISCILRRRRRRSIRGQKSRHWAIIILLPFSKPTRIIYISPPYHEKPSLPLLNVAIFNNKCHMSLCVYNVYWVKKKKKNHTYKYTHTING